MKSDAVNSRVTPVKKSRREKPPVGRETITVESRKAKPRAMRYPAKAKTAMKSIYESATSGPPYNEVDSKTDYNRKSQDYHRTVRLREHVEKRGKEGNGRRCQAVN